MPNVFQTAVIAAGFLISSAFGLRAQTVVDQGSTHTPRGIGGYCEISYAFAKGDIVALEAKSNKLLQRVSVMHYPDHILAKVKGVKHPKLTFTMPEEGVVIIRFVSDRSGQAQIDYTVTRTPGPGGPAGYNTKVKWKEPVSTVGGRIPEREQ